jgi:hypothetical protein
MELITELKVPAAAKLATDDASLQLSLFDSQHSPRSATDYPVSG